MEIKEIHTFLQDGLARVEAQIDASLRSDIPLLDATNRGLREHPGKMLRPMLALLVSGALGKKTPDTYRFAAAVELLHNATLLHDDVVDGAACRRGLPTVFSQLGASPAVLMGDYWLVACLKLILGAEKHILQVLELFSNTLGHLTEGELLQLEKTTRADTTQADYLRIVYGKTASLFETAALSAAISVDARETLCRAAGDFARRLGIAFQIKDDIFDYSEPSATLGKPVGIDLKEQKITQPLLCALETVPPKEAEAVRAQVARLAEHPEGEAEIRAFVRAKDGMARAARVMDQYINEALACLEAFPASAEKEYLAALARYVGDRTI